MGLGNQPETVADFPKKRERGSQLKNLKPEYQKKLFNLYGDLQNEINDFPNVSAIIKGQHVI